MDWAINFMTLATVTIDDRGMRRKLEQLGRRRDLVVQNAANDAARQTRSEAVRRVKASLNLPVAKIKSKLPIKLAARKYGKLFAQLSGEYEQVGAQSFIGWRFAGRVRGRDYVGSSRQFRFKGSRSKGLKVKFYRNRPAKTFRRAFPVRGSFFQRETAATPRYPIERIVGPSVWGEMKDKFPQIVLHGRSAYRRRFRYWLDRYTRDLR